MAVDYRKKVTASELADVGTEGGKASGDDKYIRFYNEVAHTTFDEDTTPWCAIFQTYHLRKVGIPTSVCPNFAGCTTIRDSFLIPKGIWKLKGTYTPKPGDLILFDWEDTGNNKLDHVGMVIKVDGNKVYTVEGNSKGGYTTYGVRYKSYPLTSSYIVGYGALNYESITDSTLTTTAGSNVKIETTAAISTMSAATKKMYVKKFQTWLNENFDAGLKVDGSYGPLTKKAAIMALQTTLNDLHKANLKVDGSCGPLTKAACPILIKYNRGNLVYIAQGMLYARGFNPNGFDGKFGPGMQSAIQQFQGSRKLVITSTLDQNTWYRLCNG